MYVFHVLKKEKTKKTSDNKKQTVDLKICCHIQ